MPRRTLLAPILIACGVLLLTLAGKWRVIERWGSDAPYMDQWVGEAANALIPWEEDRFDLTSSFWWAHNEHRIGWTRLCSVAQLEANGQWDPLLGMTLNAGVHAVFAMLLVWWLRAFLAGPGWVAVPATIAAVMVLPIAWENTLQSFQIQVYLLVLSGLVAVAWIPTSSPRSWRFWCGVASALFGLGTMASSFLAPAAALLVVCARAWREHRFTRETACAAVACGVIGAVGLLSAHSVPGHEHLRPASMRALFGAFGSILAWPWHDFLLVGIVMNIPICGWIILRLQDRDTPWKESEWVLLGLSMWAVLQGAAVAYSRGNGDFLSFRYTDLYSLLLGVNAAALGGIWLRSRPRAHVVIVALAMVWTSASVYGVIRRSHTDSDPWLDGMPARFAGYATHLRAYLITGDASAFNALHPVSELPFPDNAELKRFLDTPALRAILPPGVRAPLVLASDEGTVNFTPTLDESAPQGANALHVWASAGSEPALFRSQPLLLGRTRCLRLHFRADRSLGPMSLRLETDDGRVVQLSGVRFAGDRWQTAHLFAPAGAQSVRLVADTSPHGGNLRFANPIEVGTWTWAARQARKTWTWLIWLGAGSILAGMALGLAGPIRALGRAITTLGAESGGSGPPQRSG